MAPLPAPDDEHVRLLAARILERSEYAAWRPARFDWVFDWISGLWAADPVLYWTLVGGLLLVTLLLLAHIAWSLRAALAAAVPTRAARPTRTEPRFVEEAETLARDGHFLEAARYVQLATLQLLLQAHVVELARSEPNRVLRRRLDEAALPEVERADLLALIGRLERGWFRDRREDPELYAAWRELHGRLGASLHPA
jgi:hypothetical protein